MSRMITGSKIARVFLKSSAFSLIEVVIALGIFSVAIISIVSLFSGVSKNTRSLVDRDAIIGVWDSLSGKIATMSSADIYAIPTGTNAADRPEWFAKISYLNGSAVGDALNMEVTTNTSGFTNTASDGRLYRARLYRGSSSSGEVPWGANQAYYPLRVQVEVFIADGYVSTRTPLESTSLNFIWNAH